MGPLGCSEQGNHIMKEGIHHIMKGAFIGIQFRKGGLDISKEGNQLGGYASSSDRSRAIETGIKREGQTRAIVYSAFIDHKKLC